MKKNLFTALAVFLTILVAFVSCGSEPSGKQDPQLEYTITKSTTEGSVTIGEETWYRVPFDLTFEVNQSVDIRAQIFYFNDKEPEERTFQGRSATIHVDEDCNISFSASTKSSQISAFVPVKFLTPLAVAIDSSDDTSQTEGVMSLNLGSPIYISYCENRLDVTSGIVPIIRYTTDGSDPHTSGTASEFTDPATGMMPTCLLNFDESMTKIRAYAKVENWNDGPEAQINLAINKTDAPIVSPDGEGTILLEYGTTPQVEYVADTWYTTNPNLTTDDIDLWVWCGTSIPMETPNLKVRLVSKDYSRLYSDIVEKTFRIQLPAAQEVSREAVDANTKMTLTFSRGSGPASSTVECRVNGYLRNPATDTDDGNNFTVTVDTGSLVSVKLKKEGYADSEPLTLKALNKLNNPTSTTQTVAGTRYQKLYLQDQSGKDATIKYILDGVERAYTDYIEIRETSTVTYWAEKANYDNSDKVTTKVTVDYNVGDTGPAGGIIVYSTGSDLGEWKYIELLDEYFTGVFGYYAKRDNDIAYRVGTTDNGGFGGGEKNTELLATTMKGHAYANREDKIYRPKVLDKIDSFVALSAYEYSLSVNLHDRTVVYDDWYLPARDEMRKLLSRQREGYYNASCLKAGFNYWTSVESTNDQISGSAYIVTYNDRKFISDVDVAKSSNTRYVILRSFK